MEPVGPQPLKIDDKPPAKLWRDRIPAPILKAIQYVPLMLLILFTGAIGYFGYDYISRYYERSLFEPEPSNLSAAGSQEWRLASADHGVVATAAAACSKIFDLRSQPDYVRAQLRLDTLSDGRRNRSSPSKSERASEQSTDMVLSNYHRAAIYLSDFIARARTEAATNASANYTTMFWFQLSIVAIGAITTILISIKSISNTGQTPNSARGYFWIGIAAIIFSSLGTATSALNSFYGPRESYFKSERSLASLRQLHADVVARVTSAVDTLHPENCPKFDPLNKDDPYGKQVQDWTTKLGAILNATDSGSSSAQTASGAGSPIPQTKGGAGTAATQ